MDVAVTDALGDGEAVAVGVGVPLLSDAVGVTSSVGLYDADHDILETVTSSLRLRLKDSEEETEIVDDVLGGCVFDAEVVLVDDSDTDVVAVLSSEDVNESEGTERDDVLVAERLFVSDGDSDTVRVVVLSTVGDHFETVFDGEIDGVCVRENLLPDLESDTSDVRESDRWLAVTRKLWLRENDDSLRVSRVTMESDKLGSNDTDDVADGVTVSEPTVSEDDTVGVVEGVVLSEDDAVLGAVAEGDGERELLAGALSDGLCDGVTVNECGGSVAECDCDGDSVNDGVLLEVTSSVIVAVGVGRLHELL